MEPPAGAAALNLLKQVRFAPSFDNAGQFAGIQVTKVLPGTALEKAGLRSGDTIVAVNGVKLSGPKDVPKLLRSLGKGERSCLETLGANGKRATHCWDTR